MKRRLIARRTMLCVSGLVVGIAALPVHDAAAVRHGYDRVPVPKAGVNLVIPHSWSRQHGLTRRGAEAMLKNNPDLVLQGTTVADLIKGDDFSASWDAQNDGFAERGVTVNLYSGKRKPLAIRSFHERHGRPPRRFLAGSLPRDAEDDPWSPHHKPE